MYQFKIRISRLATIEVTIDAKSPDQPGQVRYSEQSDSDKPSLNLVEDLKTYVRQKGGLVSSIDPDFCRPADFAHAIETQYKGPNDRDIQLEVLEIDPKLDGYKLPELPLGAIY